MQTLRIVGISGVGKTTLIKHVIKRNPTLIHASYGEYFKKYKEGANYKLREFIFSSEGLILLDEHLEIGNDDLTDSYREEKTVGIFFLEVSTDMLISRRLADFKRRRSIDKNRIIYEQAKAKKRALFLARTLHIPLEIILDLSIEKSIFRLESFIKSKIKKY